MKLNIEQLIELGFSNDNSEHIYYSDMMILNGGILYLWHNSKDSRQGIEFQEPLGDDLGGFELSPEEFMSVLKTFGIL